MRDELVQYFNQVLGIREVLLPTVESSDQEGLSPIEQPKNVQVLFVDDKPWAPQASDLFQKMRAAMKLTAEQVEVLFLDQVSKADLQMKALVSSAVVNFSQDSLKEIPADIQFQTISPSRLIDNPALKKEAWLELQKVMSALL